MTDNHITLLCIENGETTPFSIDIDPTKTVDHLKDAIKIKKTPRFDDVAAYELTLWRVSIPLLPLKERKPIILTEVKSTTELDPTDDVSDEFKETPPKKTVHIIVQRPLSVHAPVRARASTPLSGHLSDASRPGTPLS
ncbi:hypothetical protein BGZ99_009011, partial [Dissophora globulifera]